MVAPFFQDAGPGISTVAATRTVQTVVPVLIAALALDTKARTSQTRVQSTVVCADLAYHLRSMGPVGDQ